MSADLLRRAAAKAREVAEAATPGPWRFGDNQLIAGVTGRHGEGRCAYCGLGDPAWSGRRDINGTRMDAHIHESADPWSHGIYAERVDGNRVVVNDTDEYGYMHEPDAAHIALWHPGVALAVADWLDVTAVHVENHDCEAHCEPNGCGLVLAALTAARLLLGEANVR